MANDGRHQMKVFQAGHVDQHHRRLDRGQQGEVLVRGPQAEDDCEAGALQMRCEGLSIEANACHDGNVVGSRPQSVDDQMSPPLSPVQARYSKSLGRWRGFLRSSGRARCPAYAQVV